MLKLFKIDFEANDIDNVRENMLNCILYLFLVAGFFAVAAGGAEMYQRGKYVLILIYVSVYIPVICCLVFKKFLSYLVRSVLLLSSLYFLAAAVLAGIGLSGAGISLLMTFALLSTVLLGIRTGFAALIIGVVTVVLTGICMVSGVIHIDTAVMTNSTRTAAWIVAGILFVINGGIMVLCPGILQLSLAKDIIKTKRSESINETLYLISSAVNTTLDLQDLYRHIHLLLENILDVTNFFIAVVEARTNTLHFPYYADTVDKDFYPIENFDTNDSLTGMVVVNKKPLLLRKEELEKRAALNGIHGPLPLIWMGVPLIIKKEVMGVIALQSYEDPDLYNERDLDMLSAISNQIAIAIDRKQASDELEREKEVFFETLEGNPHGIALIDREDNYFYVNPRFTEITGYLLKDIPDRRTWFKKAYPDDDYRKKVIESWENVAESRQYDEDFEFRILTKEGMEKHIELRGTFLQDMTISVLTDVTHRKKAEKEMSELKDKLAQSQKMESIGLLAGGVAHDLNNVLSGIVSYPELILLDLPEDSPLRQPVLGIKNSGQKAADIVQDLLTLARRGVKTTQVVCLNDIIKQYIDSPEYRKLIEFHPNVDVALALDKDLLNMEGSVIHLTKTVMNLVSNAAEAQMSGGKITISTSNHYVDKPLKSTLKDEGHLKQDRYVLLKVADKGMGISDEDLKKIFEPFYSKKIMGRSGTGLGMAVVWGTVQDHNGFINVESEIGRGTEFYLYFPATEKTSADSRKSSDNENMGKKEKILIIDDLEEQREIASQMLEKLNYSVTAVSSGEEGVEYIRNHKVDLVFLDMIMEPGMDGLETYIKILEHNPDQKAIIVSGFSENDRVKKAQKLGAGGYLKKPYTFEKLGSAVKKIFKENRTA